MSTKRTADLKVGDVVIAPMSCGTVYGTDVTVESLEANASGAETLVTYSDWEGMFDSVYAPADFAWTLAQEHTITVARRTSGLWWWTCTCGARSERAHGARSNAEASGFLHVDDVTN